MTVELYSKFRVDPYPTRKFHKKLQMVNFIIAGHKYYSIILHDFMQLDPATLWLHEEAHGNRAFFPDSHITRFLLNDDVGVLITNLVAMGSPVPTTSLASSVPARMSAALAEPSTSGLHISQAQFTDSRKAQTTNVKIMQASMKRLANGKVEFLAHTQTFVDVTEVTANLHYTSSAG